MKSALSEQALDNIKNLIITRKMKPGDKIPSERELATMFNTSRAPIREALKILEYGGMLYRKGGYGLYIHDQTSEHIYDKVNFAVTTTSKTINELMELRVSIEADAAYFAALRRTEDELSEMFHTIEVMKQIDESGKTSDLANQYQQESTNFHIAIIRATHNTVLQGVYENLLTLLRLSREYMTARIASKRNPVSDHEAIFRKIQAQDAEGARVYMKKHLIDAMDAFNAIILPSGEDK